jgi:hypothetical protein
MIRVTVAEDKALWGHNLRAANGPGLDGVLSAPRRSPLH